MYREEHVNQISCQKLLHVRRWYHFQETTFLTAHVSNYRGGMGWGCGIWINQIMNANDSVFWTKSHLNWQEFSSDVFFSRVGSTIWGVAVCYIFLLHVYYQFLLINDSRNPAMTLTHWGRVTHICIGNLNIIGSDNGLSPERRQAIIWTIAGILLIRVLGTNLNEILSEICTFSFKKIHLKISSGKCQPFCLGLNRMC